MQEPLRTRQQRLLRRLVAAVFLLFMLAEWGSHMTVHINASGRGATIVAGDEEHRDDPCKSLVVCSDGRRHDRQTPGIYHDLMPVVSLSDAFAGVLPLAGRNETSPVPSHSASALTRPPDPQFHPPEFA